MTIARLWAWVCRRVADAHRDDEVARDRGEVVEKVIIVAAAAAIAIAAMAAIAMAVNAKVGGLQL